MRIMTHHSGCITTASTVDIAALRGEITWLDFRLERHLRALQPGQALPEGLVRRLADYCQGARYLDKNDSERGRRWRRVAAQPQDTPGGGM